MLGSLEKVIALLGTPLAVIYAIGSLAQVTNLLWVETAYKFRFVTAWHVVNMMDRTVVIGLGLKYLVWTLPTTVGILLLLPLVLRPFEGWASRNAIVRNLRQGVVFSSPGDQDQKTRLERWLWIVSSTFVVSLITVILWLPVHAALTPEEDPVLVYLPHASITLAAAPSDVESNGEVGLTGPSYGETQSGQAAQPTEVKGVLLSHDEQYWYIFSEDGPNKGQVVAIPVSLTSEIRITPDE